MPDDQQQFGEGLKGPSLRPIDDLNNKYELAVNNNDLGGMRSLLNQSVGTTVHEKTKDAISIMDSRQKEYDQKVVPFVEKLKSPDGRMSAVKDFQNVEDKPSFMSFVVETLLGNPNARLMATGGTVKPFYELGNDGKMYEVYKNELGKVQGAYDYETKQPMPQEKVAQLQIGNPLTTKRLEEQNKFNLEAKNQENEAISAWTGFAKKSEQIAGLNQGLLNKFKQHYQFSNQQLKDLIGFDTATIGKTQSYSSTADKLNQLMNGKGTNFSNEEAKALSGTFKFGGYDKPVNVGVGADGKTVTINGTKANEQDLNQLQKHFSDLSEQSVKFNVNQQGSAAYQAFNVLKPEEQQAVLDLRGYQNDLVKNYNKLKEKHDLPFLVDINAFDFLRSPNSHEATNEAIIHNANQINNFSKYRDQQLKNFDQVGQLPQAGSIQKSYLGTDSYKQSADNLTNILTNVLKKPYGRPATIENPVGLTAAMEKLPSPSSSNMTKEAMAPPPQTTERQLNNIPQGAKPPSPKETAKEKRSASDIIKNTLKVLP
jgi:hypothetical protein